MNEETRDALERKHKCAFVKRLRRKMTHEENMLWKVPRARRCRGLKFRRQVNIGPYIVDFLCKESRLVVEVDGGIHERKDRRAYDRERDAFLHGCGYCVMRIKNAEVRISLPGVLDRIGNAGEKLAQHTTTQTPPLS